MKKSTSISFSIVLIVVSALLLLSNFNLIKFPQIKGFAIWWPLMIIFIGFALVFKKRVVALSLLVLTILLFSIFIINSINYDLNTNVISKTIPLQQQKNNLNISVNFGAGKLNISDGLINHIEYEAKTSIKDNPKVTLNSDTRFHIISIDRNSDIVFPFTKINEEWEVRLPSDKSITLDVEYGAADFYFDMTSLKIDFLNIDAGVSSTFIVFEEYPTNTDIDIGASSIDMQFPKDYPVRIEIDNGLSFVDLKDFQKEGGIYYTKNFNESKDFIDITIDAGASSIMGSTR